MTRQSLKALLDAEGVRPNAYSIDGTERDESLCIVTTTGGWAVFYSERGMRSAERFFETEDEASQFMAQCLLSDPGNRVAGQ